MLVTVPKLEKNQVLRRSYSRWDVFTSQCERRYALDILFPESWRDTPATARGGQVHRFLEFLARKRKEGGAPPFSGSDDSFKGPLTWKELQVYFHGTWALLRGWQIHEVEAWTREAAGMRWTGRIDLVAEDDEGKFVLDWKTCETLTHAKGPFEVRRSLQLQAYCLALGLRRAALGYLPISGVPHLVWVTYSAEALEVAARRLRELEKTIVKRWRAAGAKLAWDGAQWYMPAEVMGHGWQLDLTHFAVASPEMPWCGERCPFWDRCLGKK